MGCFVVKSKFCGDRARSRFNNTHSVFKGTFTSFKIILFTFVFILLFLNLTHLTEATVQVEMVVEDVAPFGKPKEINVAPGSSGTVNYNADVLLRRWPPSSGQVFVNFYPLDVTEGGTKDGQGWGGQVIQPQIVFGPMAASLPVFQTYNVTVSVNAPPMELMSSKRNVTINGHWTLNPGIDEGEVIPFTIPVAIKHYYLFLIQPIKFDIKVWPSEPAKFKLGIKNVGNAEDQYLIEVNPEDRSILEKYGFVVELKQTTLRVPPNEVRTFEFYVHGPQRNFYFWKSLPSMIPIRISTPEAAEGEGIVRIFQVTYYEVGIYIPDPCLILIVIGIIVLIILIILRKKGKLRRRKRRSKKK